MDENYLFYTAYKNEISDIVTLMTEMFVSVLKLETEQIKSIVFSSDKRGIYAFEIELTMMTILTLKHIYNDEKIKEFLEKSKTLKATYQTNSNSLQKIVKLLAPLKEEKISLYYNLIKTVTGNDKALASNKQIDTPKKTVYQTNLDQFSSRNENHSTHCSLTSNYIVVDLPQNKCKVTKSLQSNSSLSELGM